MLKKALKISIMISLLGIGVLVGAIFLTKTVKKEIKKAETTVPEKVEYLSPKVISEKKMVSKVKKKLKKPGSLFQKEYQKAAKAIIEKYKKEGSYTLENPLLIVNPYGTNKTGLYIYFRHFLRVNTKYTVSVKSLDTENEMNIPDFSASMYTNTSNMPLAEQEGQIIGLISGVTNYVNVYLYDENEVMIAKAGYKIELPKEETDMMTKLAVEHDREIEQLSEGLFAVFGLNPKRKERSLPLYDNTGILRARLVMEEGEKTKDVNLKFLENKIFYAIHASKYAMVNSLGYVEKVFDFGKGYEGYGDFDFTPANRYMLTFAKKKGSKDRFVMAIDLYNGKTKELISLKKVIPELFKEEKLNFTSLRIVNDNDILISEKETSSVIRINNVFRRPEVKGIFSGKGGLEKKKEVLYEKVGDFLGHFAQDSVYTDRNEKMEKRNYHIHLFNTKTGKGKAEYYRYLVDENKRTYELADKIEFPYEEEVGGLSKNGENFVFSFGKEGIFEEYNADKNRLAKYSLKGEKIYRASKFDMKGSWFTK